MIILLTGATGFLGSYLRDALTTGGHIVAATASRNNPDTGIVGMDLTNPEEVKKTVEEIKPQAIIHTGAIVNLSRSLDIASKCIDINLKGSLHLLEACKNIRLKTFIFISTEEVYGAGPIPFVESQLPDPPSMYSVTKLAVERLSASYAAETGFRVRSIRMATMYGPGNRESRFIPSLIRQAISGAPMLLNSGTKKRDYIYIDDAVDAVCKSLSSERGNRAETINIGGGTSYSLLDLARLVKESAGSSSEIQTHAFPDRVNEADEWLMDITNAENLLEWTPKTSLQEGISKTVKFWKNKTV